MIFRDTPKNRIEDPLGYLRGKHPGRDFDLQERVMVDPQTLEKNGIRWNLPGDPVPPYYIREYNACALYAEAAMMAFHLNLKELGERKASAAGKAYGQAGAQEPRVRSSLRFFPQAYPLSARDMFPGVLDLYRSSGCSAVARVRDYSLDNVDYRYFSRLCIEKHGLALKTRNTFSCWKEGTSQIRAGRPVLLNMWYEDGGGYFNHTVFAYGYELYTDGARQYRFFAVRDGYTMDPKPRYVLLGPNPLQAYITVFEPDG